MELSGFSEEQLDVREAIAKICSNFPNEYWAEHDESGVYPHELHAALAKDGWIGMHYLRALVVLVLEYQKLP
jgi:acyl-CoA dehydrogenase